MMRPVLHGDVTSVARALLTVEAGDWGSLCAQIFDQAVQADTYVQRHKRLHPRYGNGSLMAAARRFRLADEPTFDDTDYCQCFATVLIALLKHNAKPR